MKIKHIQPYTPPGLRKRRWRPRLRDLAVAIIGLELGVLAALVLYLLETETSIRIAFEPRPDAAVAPVRGATLLVPVAGIRADELSSTYGAPRSQAREHLGMDIMAAAGTPVLAATNGVIVGRDSTGPGGLSIHQRGEDGTTIYYYAHLSRFEVGLGAGDLVRQGARIGFVGQTGNADTPHLHFAVYTVTDPNRWRTGRHLDPYPLLTGRDAVPRR
ncbi:MAG: M23 family metallopeptidase [Longimicrobiales bacterium]